MEDQFIRATLCYPIEGENILLGLKKRKLGKGYFNGFGGRVEEGETMLQAAVRELREECGLVAYPERLTESATIRFFGQAPDAWEVHVFLVSAFMGEPVETEEMIPEWFSIDELPYERMWTDDHVWLPRVLQGERIHGEIHYKVGTNEIERSFFGKVT